MINSKHLKLIISILPISLITVTACFALWQWHDDWVLAHQPLVSAANLSKDANTQLIADLPDYHLFGQDLSHSGNAPITNLELRLSGIVKIEGADTNLSKAYISISGQPSKVYQVGDALPDGVKIYAITNDTIMLENEGHLEKLPLHRPTLQFKQREQEDEEE